MKQVVTANLNCHEKDTQVCNFLLSGLSSNTSQYMQKSPRYQKAPAFLLLMKWHVLAVVMKNA